MRIVTAPNPILFTAVKKVVNFDDDLKKLAEKMILTMRANKGIGLAANQIGADCQVILIEYALKRPIIPLTAVVNPKLVSQSPKWNYQVEGCLSLPGKEFEVARSEAVKIKGFNLKGKPITLAAKGLFARIIQHEMDHLRGILINDH